MPHTEAGRITVNGAAATLQRIVRTGDSVEVFPWQGEIPDAALLFVADAHLGGLARFLRMLGYDTVHDNALQDPEIRRLAVEENRTVLTRDRDLLKCADIARGAYVRALKPEAQLREIDARFRLAARAHPFTLCLACNVAVEPVPKAQVQERLPAQVAQRHDSFVHCARCDRVFWRGSHYERMVEALQAIFRSG